MVVVKRDSGQVIVPRNVTFLPSYPMKATPHECAFVMFPFFPFIHLKLAPGWSTELRPLVITRNYACTAPAASDIKVKWLRG